MAYLLTQDCPINSKDMAAIPPSVHGIAHKKISNNAIQVLRRLDKAGYAAYLVGGAVRDLLLGKQPKDFDVATDASPEQVRDLFRRGAHIIGRRFRIVHVRSGREIIEVTTFRGGHSEARKGIAHQNDSGRLIRDNVYGDISSDAWRRDLTVNALFYNIRDRTVVDFVGGMADVTARQLRIIGDPPTRYREDPVRMLRLARFVAKLGFTVDDASYQPLAELSGLLREIPRARLYDEVLKLFHKGHALRSFETLRAYGLLDYLFSQVEASLVADQSGDIERFIRHGLNDTDKRVHEGRPLNPAFLYAFLLWGAYRKALARDRHNNTSAMMVAGNKILHKQLGQTAIPRRLLIQARDIWMLQPRFAKLAEKPGARSLRLLQQPLFRAAYDFLLLRNRTGEPLQQLCDWWTDFQRDNAPVTADYQRPAPARRRRRRQ